jgi:hypothetical protein
MLSGLNDLYVRCQFNGLSDKWHESDTHWRCKKGNGSFN